MSGDRTRISVSGPPLDSETLAILAQQGQRVVYVNVDDGDVDALDGCWAHVLGGAEVFDGATIAKLPDSLELVCFIGTGYASYMDAAALGERGIAAAYTPHANAHATAEFALALLLMGLRVIPTGLAQIDRCEWSPPQGRSVRTTEIGVVGFGHVGRELVRMLSSGFGARPLVWNRTPCDDEIRAAGGEPVALADLFRISRAISLHASPSSADAPLIGRDLLNAAREDLILINTARGALVDDAALRETLEAHPGMRVLADVYPTEPACRESDPHGMLALGPERFLLTPHMAYASDDSTGRMGAMVADNVRAYLAGDVLPHPAR